VLKRSLCFLILLAFGSSAVAQTAVEGSIRDNTGKAVSGASVALQRAEGSIAQQTTSDAVGKFRFANVEAGGYTLKTEAPGFFPSNYDFVLRPRQPVSLAVDLEPKQSVQQTVEVTSSYLTIDPEKTGSSYFFTQRELSALPVPLTLTTSTLVNNLMPGASDSHDNFLAVRGTEFSLHEFINGVSFLDNTMPQFSPGISPGIFETVDLMTGGFTSEYGNRFGGVLDITTRTGAELGGHGDINFTGATVDNYDLNGDYGGTYHKLGYYFFGDGFTSGRFLDPPQPEQLYDFGFGGRGAGQFDYQATEKDSFKLLLMGGSNKLQQPNIAEDQEVGRNAQRDLYQQTAIGTWVHTFDPETILATSVYERTASDHVHATTDPITPYSVASRAVLTVGVKSDLSYFWRGNSFKAGVDLVHLRENEAFFYDSRGDPDIFPVFSGGKHGDQESVYGQDHFTLFHNLTVDLGLRYDHFDLVDTAVQVSPRVGLAYHFTKTHSVLHAAYNRYFSPPPIEYSLLASFLGNHSIDPDERVGNVRAYTQNYTEVGWAQEIHPNISWELNAYVHTGHNSFENHEIGISRVFVPINFHTARSEGLESVLNIKKLERFGITGRLQVAFAKTYFYGPVTGGFTGDEPLEPGERIVPAFDQTETGTAQIFYHNKWRGFWAGSAMRYGSGTIVEGGERLPQHFTCDLVTGINVWNAEPRRLDLEFDVTNVSNSIYEIAKESEETPIQYAPSRTVGGTLKFHF
jgi:outer membrane receptor protein involved in Fe transport